MTDSAKMIQRINRVVGRLNPEYLRKVMVCVDTYYGIQMERGG